MIWAALIIIGWIVCGVLTVRIYISNMQWIWLRPGEGIPDHIRHQWAAERLPTHRRAAVLFAIGGPIGLITGLLVMRRDIEHWTMKQIVHQLQTRSDQLWYGASQIGAPNPCVLEYGALWEGGDE